MGIIYGTIEWAIICLSILQLVNLLSGKPCYFYDNLHRNAFSLHAARILYPFFLTPFVSAVATVFCQSR